MPNPTHAVTLCGHTVPCGHICAFVGSVEERYRMLNPFFREGLEGSEELITIVDAASHDDHLERMRDGGIQVDAALSTGQFSVLASDDTYLADGMFVVDRMYALLEAQLQASAAGPWGHTRIYGDAEWIMRHLQTTDELMAYEAKVNLLAPNYDCTLLCVYNVNQCSGQAVADALATHPHVVLGERVYANPFFVDPLEFLTSVSLRRTRPAALHAPL
jgi:hypothetical protein